MHHPEICFFCRLSVILGVRPQVLEVFQVLELVPPPAPHVLPSRWHSYLMYPIPYLHKESRTTISGTIQASTMPQSNVKPASSFPRTPRPMRRNSQSTAPARLEGKASLPRSLQGPKGGGPHFVRVVGS